MITTIPVLSNDYYVSRGHTEDDCFYYPENNGGPVILNGVCEEQNPVTDFNVNAVSINFFCSKDGTRLNNLFNLEGTKKKK